MVKSRVIPEWTSINIGYDNPIPPCPVPGHAWKRVICNNEATWLAHFKDEKNKYSSSNTGKYLFLAADSKLKGDNDKKKYERARRLKACIHKVREDYNKLMASENKEQQQLGVATYFIDRLALRVGNEKNEDEADTVGCCSLRVEHVTVSKDKQQLVFDFLGKDSMRYYNEVEVPKNVYEIMKSLALKPDGSVKDAKDDLFDKINAGRLNDFLKTFMNDLSAKVFRTYNASTTLEEQLRQKGELNNINAKSPLDTKVKFFNDCNRDVALLCNHKKAESKTLGEQLAKMETKISDKCVEVKKLESWKKKLKNSKSKTPDNPDNLPKTADACDTKITKLNEQIKNDTFKMHSTRDNA